MIGTKQLAKLIKKMRISSNTVIAIKGDSPLATEETLREFGDVIRQTNMRDIILVVVEDLSDIAAFPPEALAKAGWFKSDVIKNLIAKREAGSIVKTEEEAKDD